MYARKKVHKVDDLTGAQTPALRRQLERCGAKPSHLDAMLDDLHLIEAALASDRIVVSRDEEVRHLFSTQASSIPLLRQVSWVNPDLPDDDTVAWLEAGARHEAARTLGSGEP
jgi:hypothetical protein